MSEIYELDHTPQVEKVLKEMELKLAKEFGITLRGNRLTLRWFVKEELVQVRTILLSVTTPQEGIEERETEERFQQLAAKYKVPSDELYFAQHGEYPQ